MPLSKEQKQQLNSLVTKYYPIFQDKSGLHTFCYYKCYVREHFPYKMKPYPVPFSRHQVVQKEIEKMLEWGGHNRAI